MVASGYELCGDRVGLVHFGSGGGFCVGRSWWGCRSSSLADWSIVQLLLTDDEQFAKVQVWKKQLRSHVYHFVFESMRHLYEVMFREAAKGLPPPALDPT